MNDEFVETSQDEFSHEAVSDTNSANVYSISIRMPFKIVRTINIFFPDEPHSLTHGSRSAITYAQMAGMFLKTGGWTTPVAKRNGNWDKWFGRNVSPMASGLIDRLKARVQLATTEQAKQAQKIWRSALAKKEPREILAKARKQIRDFKSKWKKYKIHSSIKTPDKSDWWNEDWRSKRGLVKLSGGIVEQSVQVYAEQARFSKLKKSANKLRRDYRFKFLTATSEYKKLKRELVDTFGDSVRNETIEELNTLYANAVMTGSNDAKIIFGEQIRLWTNPFAVTGGVSGIVKDLARELCDEIKNAILGAKAPDISDRTKQNRAYYGNPTDPPLSETGEFAESIQWEVV